MSNIKFAREFKKALEEAGYDTREKIIELVREVKREMAEESWQKYEFNKNQL